MTPPTLGIDMSNPLKYCKDQGFKFRESTVLAEPIDVEQVKDLDDSTLNRFLIELTTCRPDHKEDLTLPENDNPRAKAAIHHRAMIWTAFYQAAKIEKETRNLDVGERFYDLVAASMGAEATKALMSQARRTSD